LTLVVYFQGEGRGRKTCMACIFGKWQQLWMDPYQRR